jgi:hypothetical protein
MAVCRRPDLGYLLGAQKASSWAGFFRQSRGVSAGLWRLGHACGARSRGLSFADLGLLRLLLQPCGAQGRYAVNRGLLLAAVIFGGLGPFGHNFGEERFRCHAPYNARHVDRFRRASFRAGSGKRFHTSTYPHAHRTSGERHPQCHDARVQRRNGRCHEGIF